MRLFDAIVESWKSMGNERRESVDLDLEVKTWESPRDETHGRAMDPWCKAARSYGRPPSLPPIHPSIHSFIHPTLPRPLTPHPVTRGLGPLRGERYGGCRGAKQGTTCPPWAVNSEPARGCSSARWSGMGGGWLRLYTIRALADREVWTSAPAGSDKARPGTYQSQPDLRGSCCQARRTAAF